MDDYILIENLIEDDFDWNNAIDVVLHEAEDNLEVHGNFIPHIRDLKAYTENYFENVVPRYSINDFKSHFRMTRIAVEQLCGLLAPLLRERHLFISLEKKVLFFIWILGKQESFLATSDRFGFGKGTGHYIFKKILRSMIQLKEHLIKWPNAAQRNQIAARIENKCRIPGVVDAIDGSHIIIKQPIHNSVDFYNRKEQHSIILQAVCDDSKIFTDVFVGMPGRLHDARVFRNSPLYDKIINDPPLLPPEQHLLGDAAYPLLQNLFKPFRDNGHLTPEQHHFNIVLNGQRSVIERAFALLKGKWRRLKFLDMSLAQSIPEVVVAACILHNFVLITDADEEEYLEDNDILHQQDEGYGVNNEACDDAPGGMFKRNYITTIL